MASENFKLDPEIGEIEQSIALVNKHRSRNSSGLSLTAYMFLNSVCDHLEEQIKPILRPPLDDQPEQPTTDCLSQQVQ